MFGKLFKPILVALTLVLALSVNTLSPATPTGLMADVCGTTASCPQVEPDATLSPAAPTGLMADVCGTTAS